MRRSAAFTLIELTLVAVIILALIALSSPLFKSTFSDITVKDASYNISKLITYAEEKAIIERKEFKLLIDKGKSGYRLVEPAQTATTPDRKITGRFGRFFKLPRGVSINSEKKYITFYPDGRCDTVKIDLFDKTGKGYRISSRGFGSLVEVSQLESD